MQTYSACQRQTQEPNAVQPYLALVVHDSKVAPLDSLVKLCIRKDDGGTLASTFQGDVLEVVRSVLHDGAAGVCAASEGHLINTHVTGNSLTSLGPKTGQDVDNTSRKTSLDHQLSKVQGRERCLLGRLEHNSVTAGQGGGNLPCKHHEGKVPGDNLSAHAERLLENVC